MPKILTKAVGALAITCSLTLAACDDSDPQSATETVTNPSPTPAHAPDGADGTSPGEDGHDGADATLPGQSGGDGGNGAQA